jgi:hypothetical protein
MMTTFNEFLKESVITKAEWTRVKDAINKDIRKEFATFEKEFHEISRTEHQKSRDQSGEGDNWNWNPTKAYQAIDKLPFSEILVSDFKKTRKAIEGVKEFYPDLYKKFKDLLDKFQPRVDELEALKANIGKREVLTKEQKIEREIKQPEFDKNRKDAFKIVKAIAKEAHKSFAAKAGDKFNLTEDDLFVHLSYLVLEILQKTKDVNLTTAIQESLTTRSGNVNGWWKLKSDDGRTFSLFIDTIYAGGYNIQKFHTRTKVTIKEIK